MSTATRVVLSYPEDLSTWGRGIVDDTTEFVFTDRSACGVGGWQGQSRQRPE